MGPGEEGRSGDSHVACHRRRVSAALVTKVLWLTGDCRMLLEAMSAGASNGEIRGDAYRNI